jgi:hypothetical protein
MRHRLRELTDVDASVSSGVLASQTTAFVACPLFPCAGLMATVALWQELYQRALAQAWLVAQTSRLERLQTAHPN